MILELIILVIVVIIFKILFLTPRNLPPGEYGWPVVGHFPSTSVSMYDQVEMMKRKHGKTFMWKMGRRNFLFLCDYNILKTVFAKTETSFRPHKMFSFEVFSGYKSLGFANNEGKPIQNLRRFTMTNMKEFGFGKASMEDIVTHELECLIQEFNKHTGKPVEVPWSLNIAVINVLWKLIADKRFDVSNKEIQDFERLITSLFEDVQHPLVMLFDMFPLLAKLMPFSLQCKLGLSKLFKNIDVYISHLAETIKDHEKNLDTEHPKDFIDSFLIEMKLNEQGKGTEKTFNFTNAELLYSLSDLFTAGSETTSSTFRWIVLYLAKYSKVQKKVQDEIDNVLPKDKLPTLNDRDKFVYTQAVINEVMRLKPIANFGLYHSAKEDLTIDGHHVPKNTILVPSILSCHLDPDMWENPDDFIPERFISPDGTFRANKDGFLPFSTGKRVCIGESLARMVLLFFVVGVFQHFNFAAPEGVELNTERDVKKPLFMIPNPFEVIIAQRK